MILDLESIIGRLQGKPRASGDDPYVERGEEFIYL